MDIFNLKKVEDLESDIRGLQHENESLRAALYEAEMHIKKLLDARDNTPTDCKPGPYCAGCNFAKEYRYVCNVGGRKSWTGYNSRYSGFVCGKGSICKNFIQKEIKE